MPSVTLTDEQVVDLVRQLSPERRGHVLALLAADPTLGRDARMALAQARLRELAARQGRDWDAMPDGEREAFLDDLVHEGRACPP
jgi:hypothetical protein